MREGPPFVPSSVASADSTIRLRCWPEIAPARKAGSPKVGWTTVRTGVATRQDTTCDLDPDIYVESWPSRESFLTAPQTLPSRSFKPNCPCKIQITVQLCRRSYRSTTRASDHRPRGVQKPQFPPFPLSSLEGLLEGPGQKLGEMSCDPIPLSPQGTLCPVYLISGSVGHIAKSSAFSG